MTVKLLQRKSGVYRRKWIQRQGTDTDNRAVGSTILEPYSLGHVPFMNLRLAVTGYVVSSY